MRWSVFLGIAVVTVTLQTTVAHYIELAGVRPDWVLIVVLFYAFHATYPAAVIGGTVMGFIANLMTSERLGPFIAAYGGAAFLAYIVRDYLFIRHGKAQFIVALVIAGLVEFGWVVYRSVCYPQAAVGVGKVMWLVLGQATYTAAFAPLIHGLLLKVSGRLGLRTPRYGFKGIVSVAPVSNR